MRPFSWVVFGGVLLALAACRASWAAGEADKAPALLGAVEKGQANRVKKLLEEGADPNAKDAKGETALMKAAALGHVTVIKILFASAKALVEVDEMDEDSQTAFMKAAQNGHNDVLQVLMAKMADVNAKDSQGETALMHAAVRGHSDTVRYLLYTAKADVNAKNTKGVTALMKAAGRGYEGSVKAILGTARANALVSVEVNSRDKEGKTALKYASDAGHKEVAELLQREGGKE
jgi:ankyrin repeat protein